MNEKERNLKPPVLREWQSRLHNESKPGKQEVACEIAYEKYSCWKVQVKRVGVSEIGSVFIYVYEGRR